MVEIGIALDEMDDQQNRRKDAGYSFRFARAAGQCSRRRVNASTSKDDEGLRRVANALLGNNEAKGNFETFGHIHPNRKLSSSPPLAPFTTTTPTQPPKTNSPHLAPTLPHPPTPLSQPHPSPLRPPNGSTPPLPTSLLSHTLHPPSSPSPYRLPHLHFKGIRRSEKE